MSGNRITAVQIWLIVGLFMILMQVFIGGITRLTGSGLSITKWDIVSGTIPPLNENKWKTQFELYKQTPQYQKINKGMSLSEFKFIFFWEYFHRLWARTMGFVFLLPLIFFIFKRKISSLLGKRLFIVFLLAALNASMGWIMVASGLIERPWVNAYKLSFHLILALILFLYLLWVVIQEFRIEKEDSIDVTNRIAYKSFFWILFVQIFLGGMMSGMRASMIYPTWPKIGDSWIPAVLTDFSHWTYTNFGKYDEHHFLPALVHFLHRNLAYLILCFGLYLFFKNIGRVKSALLKTGLYLQITFMFLQVILGVLTLIHSKGRIPIWYGVFHQLVGFLLISAIVYILSLGHDSQKTV